MSGRIRTVKPEWLEDEALLRAGSHARVLSISLMLLADDHGNGRCIPEVMASQVFPFEESSRVFREALARLSRMGFAVVYQVRGQTYFSIENWKKHQRVDKPGKPRVPGPETEGSRRVEDVSEIFATPSRDSRDTLAPDHDHDHDHDQDQDLKVSSPNGLSSESRQAGDVRRVFDHWKLKTWNGKGPEPKLDGKRKSRIAARLREGLTVDQLCRAVDGALSSPWHTGDNPAGKSYLGVQTLLRDREAVEQHIARLDAPATRPGSRALTPEEFEIDEDPLEASYG